MVTRYNITLDEKVVDEVKTELEKTGGGLSGLINAQLKKWLIEQDSIEVLEKKLEELKKKLPK